MIILKILFFLAVITPLNAIALTCLERAANYSMAKMVHVMVEHNHRPHNYNAQMLEILDHKKCAASMLFVVEDEIESDRSRCHGDSTNFYDDNFVEFDSILRVLNLPLDCDQHPMAKKKYESLTKDLYEEFKTPTAICIETFKFFQNYFRTCQK